MSADWRCYKAVAANALWLQGRCDAATQVLNPSGIRLSELSHPGVLLACLGGELCYSEKLEGGRACVISIHKRTPLHATTGRQPQPPAATPLKPPSAATRKPLTVATRKTPAATPLKPPAATLFKHHAAVTLQPTSPREWSSGLSVCRAGNSHYAVVEHYKSSLDVFDKKGKL